MTYMFLGIEAPADQIEKEGMSQVLGLKIG